MPTAKMIVAQSFQLPQPLPPTLTARAIVYGTYSKQKEVVAAVDDDLSITTVTAPQEILPMHRHQSTPCLPTTTMMT